MRRVDHRDLRIRIRPVPLVKPLHRLAQRVNVAVGLRQVVRPNQQPYLHRPDAAAVLALHLAKIRRRAPGEIMDRIPMKRHRLAAVRVIDRPHLHPLAPTT